MKSNLAEKTNNNYITIKFGQKKESTAETTSMQRDEPTKPTCFWRTGRTKNNNKCLPNIYTPFSVPRSKNKYEKNIFVVFISQSMNNF